MSIKPKRTSPSAKDDHERAVHWISVEEELPPKDFIIIVYDTDLLVGLAVAVFDGNNFVSVSGDKLIIYSNVTHWMNLPDPPQC